jgi:hypothetical protein
MKIAFIILPFLFGAVFAEIPNPAFGGKNNQLSVFFGQSVWGKHKEKLFNFGFFYSQPNDFFRLPGRRNVELMTQRGAGKLSRYNNDAIFGFSQDLISPALWRMYAGINLGIYIKSEITDRIGSRFTFGERAFIGCKIIDDYVLELYARHFSNGDLTKENGGQNFIGLSVMWNFGKPR